MKARAVNEPGGGRFRKLPETLARRIADDIIARELRPGDMLSAESAMAASYGVSRESLREALRILEVFGLIAIKPGPRGGPMVARVGSAEFARTSTLYYHVAGARLRQLMQARLLLEPVMARLAAEKSREPALQAELSSIVARVEDAHPDDEQSWLPVANEFHDEISDMAGNRALSLVVRSLRDIYVQRVSSALYPPAEPIADWHEKIARAILSGQAEEAERLMRAHMQEFSDYTSERVPSLLDEVVDWR